MNTKKLGSFGEKIAVKYLKNKGYKILGQNYSSKLVSGPLRGEIDIIVRPSRSVSNVLRGKKDNIIHFIEVKTLFDRGRASDISPEEKVNFEKQKKLVKTAENWLMEKKIPLNSKWQIDVISIKIDLNTKKAKIQHFKNAVF